MILQILRKINKTLLGFDQIDEIEIIHEYLMSLISIHDRMTHRRMCVAEQNN